MDDGGAQVDLLIHELEQQMSDLQLRHGDVFGLANAWAERYDAIVAMTPPALLADVETRLSRIGIRWGMMPGMRVTGQFRAIGSPGLPADNPGPEAPPDDPLLTTHPPIRR